MEDIAVGKEPEQPISQKDWDDVLKTIKEMPNLERLYSTGSEHADKLEEKEPILGAEIEQPKGGNAFEEASKRVKERLNGSTKISTKAH